MSELIYFKQFNLLFMIIELSVMSIFEDFNQENRRYWKIIYRNTGIILFQCLIVKIKETKVKFDTGKIISKLRIT